MVRRWLIQTKGELVAECKCVDCGFLELIELHTNSRHCAPAKYRREGKIPVKGGSHQFRSSPDCFKGVDIGYDQSLNDNETGYAVAIEVRQCDKFTEWVAGRTSKEHDDMNIWKAMEQQTLQRQDALEAQYEKRHQELRKDAAKYHRHNLAVALIGVVVAILSAIATVKLTM